MKHNMKLFKDPFNRIKNGKKVREYRLYDEKRKQVKLGDTIIFTKLPNKDETLEVIVENINTFPNFYSMFKTYFESDFSDRYKNVEEIVNNMYENYYSKEKEEKYGCVAIKIKKV